MVASVRTKNDTIQWDKASKNTTPDAVLAKEYKVPIAQASVIV